MARTGRISPEQLKTAQKKLRGLPAKDGAKTKRETIAILRKDIQSALQKGHSLDDISNILQSTGITVAASTLKSYLAVKEVSSTENNTENFPSKKSNKNFVKPDTADL